jgi:glycine/D-amino acid oxidase-like deaminating enzyme
VGHRRFDYDVLVIGAGGAGLRAAIAAAERGKVALICVAARQGAPSWVEASPRPSRTSTTRRLDRALRRHDARRQYINNGAWATARARAPMRA